MIVKTKEDIRGEMKKMRREFEKKEEASAKICETIINMDEYKNAACVCIYMAAFGEADLDALISNCRKNKKKIAIPVTDKTNSEITLSYIGNEFVKGAYSIREPKEIVEVNFDEVDFAAIPGIAFDEKFNRIGFGKGCYDRFLKDTRAYKCGVCYDFQILKTIPSQKHDIKMDVIVSEKRCIKKY